MWRIVLAILAGFISIGLLSQGADYVAQHTVPWAFDVRGRVEDPRVLLGILAYVFAFGVFGCYLTAVIARRRPIFFALMLGVFGLVLNLIGVLTLWETAPAWYWMCSLALVMPAAFLGGLLRVLQLRSRQRARLQG